MSRASRQTSRMDSRSPSPQIGKGYSQAGSSIGGSRAISPSASRPTSPTLGAVAEGGHTRTNGADFNQDWDTLSETFSENGIVEDVFGELEHPKGLIRTLQNVEPRPQAIHLQEHRHFEPKLLDEVVMKFSERVQSLNLRNCQVNDTVVRSIRDHTTCLRRLDLGHCPDITSKSLEFTLSAPSLANLKALYINNLSPGAVNDVCLINLRATHLMEVRLQINSKFHDNNLFQCC